MSDTLISLEKDIALLIARYGGDTKAPGLLADFLKAVQDAK
jgi:hypothetical protein